MMLSLNASIRKLTFILYERNLYWLSISMPFFPSSSLSSPPRRRLWEREALCDDKKIKKKKETQELQQRLFGGAWFVLMAFMLELGE